MWGHFDIMIRLGEYFRNETNGKVIWDLLGGFFYQALDVYILFCLYLIFFSKQVVVVSLYSKRNCVWGGDPMGKVTMYIQDKQGRSLALKS